MITTLTLSFQHLVIVFIILGIPTLIIYLIIKSRNNDKKLMLTSEVNTIGTDNPTLNIDEETNTNLEKYGKISEKSNLFLYILTFTFLLFFTMVYTINKRGNYDLTDGAYLAGTILAGLITFGFYITIFTLLFNPIRKLYKRYLQFSEGTIDAPAFKKFKNRSRTNTVILSIICIPLSFGVFGLLMIPHYKFLSNLNKLTF
ncbi:hypothetical protein C1637_09635 [Chryseobacterium lactis]|uniref:DUF898 family protein n=1 Tax=Chryseobacterium lactis TaxID=1241981 RepID=A0A3G6RM56_CHRLC|nr:hypothetical protein [Chryseobacterium lactis]AZA82229.1 hypothetical protein EG342_10070 [Chryseobacterium lactis]AZB02610.1 hypothetical protein EG341_00925 [Chryseobacterium lactis]PNW14096.1 hypothetical protein C1637_09635 [Chryseobacterium lactis]